MTLISQLFDEYAALAKECAELRQENHDLRAELSEDQTRLALTQNERDALQKQVNELLGGTFE